MDNSAVARPASLPFDGARLDRLLDDAGIDVLLVTSKHNVQYLLGGHRSFFFDYMDALAQSRYLPVLVYPKGRPDAAVYVGAVLEAWEKQLGRIWTPTVETASWGSVDAMTLALKHVKRLGGGSSLSVGVEAPFLPFDAARVLQSEVGDRIVDATFALERLRLVKTTQELDLLRRSSDLVVEAMGAVFDACAPGMTKSDLVQRLRQEEVSRGLTFEYCLITAGTSHNRAPSGQMIERGDILSIDSGGNFHGYIGDLCRMGIVGKPDGELEDLLGLLEEIQMAARVPVKAGALGRDIHALGESLVERSPHRPYLEFLAHGMGLVSHEGPRLTSRGVVPYEGYDADRPLEAGMVISIETTMKHPTRGYLKLEDTVAVTAEGCEGFGDSRRGWNRAGGVSR